MIKTKLKNLFGLVMFFLLFGTQFFLGLFNLTIPYAIVSELGLIFLILFVKRTFYKEKKFIFPIILITIIFFKGFNTVLRILYAFKIPPTSPVPSDQIPIYYFLVGTLSIQLIISFLWLSYAELSTYFRIKNYDIEPWVKKRYLILGISSLFFVINGFILPLIPIENGYENFIITFLVAITIFVFSFGNLIGWVMPKILKDFLNKNYVKASEEEFSESELLDKITLQLKGGKESGNN